MTKETTINKSEKNEIRLFFSQRQKQKNNIPPKNKIPLKSQKNKAIF
jgi:hypothetical protein